MALSFAIYWLLLALLNLQKLAYSDVRGGNVLVRWLPRVACAILGLAMVRTHLLLQRFALLPFYCCLCTARSLHGQVYHHAMLPAAREMDAAT